MRNRPKILWLNNIVMPEVAPVFGMKAGFAGGWLAGLFKAFKATDVAELTVVFPRYGQKGVAHAAIEGVNFYGVGIPTAFDVYHQETEMEFRSILETEKPDMVHIFGTEYPHTLAMVKAFDHPEKTVISIQGLTSVIQLHYLDGIPMSVSRSRTFREHINRRGLLFERKKFGRRGVLEAEAIGRVKHVIGRTDWDRACTTQMNPNLQYHHCYESLRDSFYDASWDINKIERNSIFVSQGFYTIKGFHMVLEAMAKLRRECPDIKLYVAGDSIINPHKKGIKRLLTDRTYPRFIEDLIVQNDLTDHVIFLGNLTESEMRERYLKSHVFVSASLVENSPNSVGEAALMGVPCVSSHVGGVAEMIVHYKEGYVYQATAPYMLAYYIQKLLQSDETCVAFSKASKEHAKQIYNRDTNGKRLAEIYREILSEKSAK